MSFGKNDSHLQRIAGYGATSSQSMGNAARRQYGPRKGSPSWANNFEPPEGLPELGRLIPGKFESERVDPNTGAVFVEETGWYEYTEHYHGTLKKSMICTAGVHRWGNREKAKPCRGCDISNEDYLERRRIQDQTGQKVTNPNRMSASSKYAFTILLMGEPSQGSFFFKGYQYDKEGRVSVGKQGQPYMEWRKYMGPNQPEYQQVARDLYNQQKQVEWRVGHVQAFPMPFGQYKALEAYSDLLQRHCKSCRAQNCIHTSAYICPHCSYPTVQEMAGLPADKLKELVNQIVECRNCKQKGYPYAVQTCQHCQQGKSATIWDVDFQFCKARVNNTSQLMIPWSSAPKDIEPQFGEVLKKLPELNKKFAETPYEEQVQKFGASQAAPDPHQPQAPQGYQPEAPVGYGYNPQQYAGGYSQQAAPPAQGWGPPAPNYQQPPAQNYTQQPGYPQPAPQQQPYDYSQQPGWYPQR